MNTKITRNYQNIIRCLRENNNFLITTHIRPDGDSIASVLIVAEILTAYKKKYQIIVDDCIPEKLNYLHDVKKIRKFENGNQLLNYQAILILDSSDLERIGRIRSMLSGKEIIVNIDHHPGNQHYGYYNLVDARMSSTVELVYPMVKFAGLSWSPELATLVYTGILSDTGRFLFANTSAHALFICAEMVRKGANPSYISEMLFNRNSPETMKAYAQALATLEFYHRDQITCIHLSGESLSRFDSIDTEGFVDTVAGINGVKVSFFCMEGEPEQFRVSFRSKGEIDVNEVAGFFGGGGHVRASGCSINGHLSDVKNRILNVLYERLNSKE